jgi:hypothetical protein
MKIMEGKHPTAHHTFTIQHGETLRDAEQLILLVGKKILSNNEFEKVIFVFFLFKVSESDKR